jgi:hypothetical protein
VLKKVPLLILSLVVLLAFTACGGAKTDSSSDGTLAVSVTFDALGEFAKAVGGDKVAVSVIIPTGTEPHDFEPKAQDLVASAARTYSCITDSVWKAGLLTRFLPRITKSSSRGRFHGRGRA